MINKWFNRWIIELIMIIWSSTCKWIDDIVKEILNDPINYLVIYKIIK